MGRRALILLFLSFAWMHSAQACIVNSPLIDVNWKTTYAKDGSFRNGGDDDKTAGLPVFDLQGERIGQVIADAGSACLYIEYLLLADCNALEMTVLHNVPQYLREEGVIWEGIHGVDALLPPDGLLGDVSDKTILEMRRYLIRNGAGDGNDLLRVNGEEKPRDQFNPFAGCKVLYPDSRGAAYEWPKPIE